MLPVGFDPAGQPASDGDGSCRQFPEEHHSEIRVIRGWILAYPTERIRKFSSPSIFFRMDGSSARAILLPEPGVFESERGGDDRGNPALIFPIDPTILDSSPLTRSGRRTWVSRS